MKERACPLGRAMLLAHACPLGLAMFFDSRRSASLGRAGGDDLVHACVSGLAMLLVHAAFLVFALPLVFCFAHLTRTASALDG